MCNVRTFDVELTDLIFISGGAHTNQMDLWKMTIILVYHLQRKRKCLCFKAAANQASQVVFYQKVFLGKCNIQMAHV